MVIKFSIYLNRHVFVMQKVEFIISCKLSKLIGKNREINSSICHLPQFSRILRIKCYAFNLNICYHWNSIVLQDSPCRAE